MQLLIMVKKKRKKTLLELMYLFKLFAERVPGVTVACYRHDFIHVYLCTAKSWYCY